jgi:branched-chain amino acid aminotransferase
LSTLYLNGQFLPAAQAVLSLADVGFIWGATVTDRLRTFRHKLFRLDDHLRRFRTSCERAFIPQPVSDQQLASIAAELIEANVRQIGPGDELSLVMFATPGDGTGRPTLGMQTSPLNVERYSHLFTVGALLEPVPSPMGLDPRIKHRSRLGWWIAGQELRLRHGAASTIEPLLTSGEPDHHVRETPTANFLAVFDGKLVSPPRSTILSGVSLQVIEELGASLGISLVERQISLKEAIASADECLLTNTSFCVAPVARIAAANCSGWISPSIAGEGDHSGNGIFRRLIKSWSDLVGVDILRQFRSNR